jgi:hypothetical protein
MRVGYPKLRRSCNSFARFHVASERDIEIGFRRLTVSSSDNSVTSNSSLAMSSLMMTLAAGL